MAVINIISAVPDDASQHANRAAVRELTEALAKTAPRACAVRIITPRNTEIKTSRNPRISQGSLPLSEKILTGMWGLGVGTKMLASEFTHGLTPVIPLHRAAKSSPDTQNTVSVCDLSAFGEHHGLPDKIAQQERGFITRAIKYADLILAASDSVAAELHERFGVDNIRIMPLAAPTEYCGDSAEYVEEQPGSADKNIFEASAEQHQKRLTPSAARRAELQLPKRYIATTASDSNPASRLDWLTAAINDNHKLPELVVLQEYQAGDDPANGSGDGSLGTDNSETERSGTDSADNISAEPQIIERAGRIHYLKPQQLADFGAVISGSQALVLPQHTTRMNYEVYGALQAEVPLLLAKENKAAADLALDAAKIFENKTDLAEQLENLFITSTEQLNQLQICAADRSKIYTWQLTATLLWEFQAAI